MRFFICVLSLILLKRFVLDVGAMPYELLLALAAGAFIALWQDYKEIMK